jgi:hypothetical protein
MPKTNNSNRPSSDQLKKTGEWPGKKNLKNFGSTAWDEAKQRREFKKDISEKKAADAVVVRKRKTQYTETI